MVVNEGERWVAAENITRWEAQLKDEKDDQRCRTLRELIGRERERLRALDSQKRR